MDNNNTAKSPSSSSDLHSHHHQFWHLINTTNNPTNPNTFNLNEENDNTDSQNDKEAMFEKPLTPSDVGKLNRLVIPKQHAERYFPIAAEASAEKGLLLSFEDDSGKPWRFRYSYWNSSQSYVLTKGWSRFVKENRLDAGDVVLFLRHRSRSDRLFIGSRRRDANVAPNNNNNCSYPTHPQNHNHHSHAGHYLSLHQNQNNRPVVPYQPDSSSIHAGLLSPAHHQNQTTMIGNNNNNNSNNNSSSNSSSKILRLFGVNLECHDNQEEQCNSEPLTPDGSSLSSQDLQHQFYPQPYYPNPLHNHMDFTFSRDVKPMRDRRG